MLSIILRDFTLAQYAASDIQQLQRNFLNLLLSVSDDVANVDSKNARAAKEYVLDSLAWHVKGACGATLVGDSMLLQALDQKSPLVAAQIFAGVSVELLEEVCVCNASINDLNFRSHCAASDAVACEAPCSSRQTLGGR